jgi:hypothetical protein
MKIVDLLAEYQFGFRKRNRSRCAIVMLRIMLEEALK